MNHANVPRSVQGPPSMPRISCTVHHQPSAARISQRATRPTLVRTTAHAGITLARAAGTAACAEVLKRSGGPGELGVRQPGFPLVLDAKRVDLRPLRLGDGQIGSHRVEHLLEPDRPAGLNPERDDVLDLEVDRVADLHAVAD